MNRLDIRERLAAGERLVLDGAMGSELQRRGVDVSQGLTEDGWLGAWSATAMRDAPETVREIHDDYLRAGAEILTTNSFWTNRVRLALVGLADKAPEYTRLAAEIALEARDRLNPDAYVAGGIAPPEGGLGGADTIDLPREFADQAAVLADAGVDLLLLEYIGCVADCVTAVDAVAGTGLPVFLGLRELAPDGNMQEGETYDQLVAWLGGRKVDAILLMCSGPERISLGMPRLREAFPGAIGAYAEVGYGKAAHTPTEPGQQFHAIDIGDNTPARYAEFGRAWLDAGAQIVGGCCATRPEHIAALRGVV